MTKVVLMNADELATGEMTRRIVGGLPPLNIYNIDGEFYATEDQCSHGMANLSEGELDGDVVECPWHGGAFYVKTGEPAERPCTVPVKTFEVTNEGGKLMVRVPLEETEKQAAEG